MIEMYRVPLHVEGVDLDDDDVAEVIADSELASLAWSMVGDRTIATVFPRVSDDPVMTVLSAVHLIAELLPDAKVREVDQDLVNITEIGRRANVGREAARHWVNGERGPGGFPEPAGYSGESKVWRWYQVAEWLKEHYGLVEEYESLSHALIAKINASVPCVAGSLEEEWQDLQNIAQGIPMRITGIGAALPDSGDWEDQGEEIGRVELDRQLGGQR